MPENQVSAVVPVPAQGNVTSFTQQGQLDWVALSKAPFSASISILSRLANAGIDPITVAFGQAMCGALPLGVHGEKVLDEAVKKLTAFSSFGDIIWFGIGIRHILRDLVQTSEGSALVALCGALSEAYTHEISALVIVEIAKLSGSPEGLRPSYTQWKSLMKVCGVVFNESSLGLRLEHFRRLGGVTDYSPSHPTDLAQVILAIGRVSSGRLDSVSVRGGSACSWVAAWAEFVLGLRVLVRSQDGSLLYINYDTRLHSGQVILEFQGEGQPTASLECVAQTIFVRSGTSFINECFGNQQSRLPDVTFLGGRLEWDSMLSQTFFDDFLDLVGVEDTDSEDIEMPPEPQLPSLSGVTQYRNRLPALFARSFTLGCAILVFHTPLIQRFGDLRSFLGFILDQLLELRPAQARLFRESTVLEETGLSTFAGLKYEYSTSLSPICLACSCYLCLKNEPKPRSRTTRKKRQWCMIGITEVSLRLAFLLSNLVLNSPLRPKGVALMNMYENWRNLRDSIFTFDHDMTRWDLLAIGPRLAAYANLFTGSTLQNKSSTQKSAINDGKIYLYVKTLEKLTDCAEQAMIVHVGSGSIEYDSRPYDAVYDLSSRSERQQYYAARRTTVVDGIDKLDQDTSTVPLSLKAFAEEKADTLSFWYQVSSNSGTVTISPANLLQMLVGATRYLNGDFLQTESDSKEGLLLLQSSQYILVEGEGGVEYSENCHLLRPHKSNQVARCVALCRSEQKVVLVKNQAQLIAFAKFFAHARAKKPSTPYYAIVS
ncbi:uncharacterized protein PV07_12279 [Cladophialophora immunda]|uniref:Uncharacterized protein n=1 Tax=Cladophialophora immunda TaxID=569365 RepID=A0A0D2CFQ5_9EURO|nr:uncharacterized protein PV07_12279 [Cladophialophora immunda]KIW22389.1 hypothetical protein PV07_12279 [Cladophialophora immunda]OQU98163.1 hypothetical protein CLAIMM_03987 [Cladophialophora immunda]